MPPGPFGAMLISRLRGAPGSSFLPENTQIEFACVGPAVAFPLPVTSPATAALALAPATTTAHTAAASIDFFRSMILSPFEVSPSLATLLRWRHRRQPSLASDSGKHREEISYAWRNKRLLFPQVLFWDLTAPFLSFASAFSVPTRTRRRTGMGAGRFCDLGQGGGRSDLRPGLFAYGKVARAEKTSIPPVPLPVHSACAFAFVEATAM